MHAQSSDLDAGRLGVMAHQRIGVIGRDAVPVTAQHNVGERRLTAAQFQHLTVVPAAVEWFANLDNPRPRRANHADLEDFVGFVGLPSAEEFRAVTRSHVLISLFGRLLESNAVTGGNPVHGVKRPKIETNEGKTPALGDH